MEIEITKKINRYVEQEFVIELDNGVEIEGTARWDGHDRYKYDICEYVDLDDLGIDEVVMDYIRGNVMQTLAKEAYLADNSSERSETYDFVGGSLYINVSAR